MGINSSIKAQNNNTISSAKKIANYQRRNYQPKYRVNNSFVVLVISFKYWMHIDYCHYGPTHTSKAEDLEQVLMLFWRKHCKKYIYTCGVILYPFLKESKLKDLLTNNYTRYIYNYTDWREIYI